MTVAGNKRKPLKKLCQFCLILLAMYLISWGVFVGTYRAGLQPLPPPDFLLGLYMPLYLLSDWTSLQGPLEGYAACWVWLFKWFAPVR
jgi:hypothetical protein